MCIDCCLLLNQCSEFYEKTNQAQTSLRQMMINPKNEPLSVPPPLEPNIDYVEKTVDFPKEEEFICDSVDDMDDAYFEEEHHDDELDKANKVRAPKKNSPKGRKRLKSQKLDECELQGLTSDDLEEGQSIDVDTKANLKIPENYMTGEIIKM